MTIWGAYDKHLRVGIDWNITPASPGPSDTEVTVTWKFMVGASASFADSELYHHNPDGEALSSTSFFNNLSDGGSRVVYTTKIKYPISRNSGTKSATATVSNTANGANPSVTATLRLPDIPAGSPGQPFGLASTGEGDVDVFLLWEAPDDGGSAIDRYTVQWDTSSSFERPAQLDVVGTQPHISGLASATKYYWRVQAHNAAGFSGPWSAQSTFATTGGQTASGAPGKPLLTNATVNSLSWSWTAASPMPDSYTFEFSSNADFATPTDVLISPERGTTYQMLDLQDATTYFVRVRANTGGQVSEWSSPGFAATLSLSPYDDYGDFATLVTNLAQAVAREVAQIGTYTLWARTAPLNVPDSTDTDVPFNSGQDTHGVVPTTLDGKTFTIAQTGLYTIEFGFGWPNLSGATVPRVVSRIVVNGLNTPIAGTPRSGRTASMAANATAPATYFVHRATMRLKAGDTIRCQVWQNTGATVTSVDIGDYYAHVALAQIGV
jgi:hypothetical protein